MKTIGLGIALLLLAGFMSGPAVAGVYKWVDDKGEVHFSQAPPPDRAATSVTVRTAEPAAKPAQAAEAEDEDAAGRCVGRLCPPDPEAVAKEQAASKREQDLQRQQEKKQREQQKASLDQKIVEDCKRRRETYCDRGAAEIRRQDEMEQNLRDARAIGNNVRRR